MEVRSNNYPIKNFNIMRATGAVLEDTSFQAVTYSTEAGKNQSFAHVATYPPIELTTAEEGYTLKRAVDIIGAGFGLFILGLIFPFIYLGIKLSSKGPVLFVQPRTGMNGRPFPCFKFRTMYIIEAESEDGKPIITKQGDNRIFPLGKILRKMNIDELPQLINVLRGDMSLVGPRPLPIKECRYWQRILPGFTMRYHNTRPGLTGWAQVTGYRGGNLDPIHMYYRLKRDLRYIENASLKLDLEIMWRTLKQIITRNTGAH